MSSLLLTLHLCTQPVIRLYSVPMSTFTGEDEEIAAGEGSPAEED
jgi:hypothetical protein